MISYKQASINPRKNFNQQALQELADSIASEGLIQPIVVRLLPGGNHYEIIAGERRWRAAKLAGLTRVPVIIREMDDQKALAVALIENIQREDLNVLEEAQALQRLLDEFSLTHQELAQTVGRSRTAVSNLLRLLNLNSDVQIMLRDNLIEMGHARALLPLSTEKQLMVAQEIIAHGLSVRETEQQVNGYLNHKAAFHEKASKPAQSTATSDILNLQNNLSESLGAPVKIKHANNGKGSITINYYSLDELDGVLEKIGYKK